MYINQIKFGELIVAILEDKIKSVIGEGAVSEIKKPLLETELKKQIAECVEHTEERWLKECNDEEIVQAVGQMPLYDLPVIQQTLRIMIDHPADPITATVFKGQLTNILPLSITEERINNAMITYLNILRTELIKIPDMRDKLSALANLETANNATLIVHELDQLKQILTQHLFKDTQLPSLYKKLPRGNKGKIEFARIVDLLLFHEERRAGKKATFPKLSGYESGDDTTSWTIQFKDSIVYEYLFCPMPLGTKNREAIIESIKHATELNKKNKISKWVLITPDDWLVSSSKSSDDNFWFNQLKEQLELPFELEHWGQAHLIMLFRQTPALSLYYYPELVEGGPTRRQTIQDIYHRYLDGFVPRYSNIEFVGMSVYKQEATRGIPMEAIYIPLEVVPSGTQEKQQTIVRRNPIAFLSPGYSTVILGDPGSGKSTLLRFLALIGSSEQLQKRFKVKPDHRLPILVVLKRYADELKQRKNLSLLDYLQENIRADFNLPSLDLAFLEFYLETGQAILLFDGLDELPNPDFKETVRNRIRTLTSTYPGNTVIVTTRIVGYDNPFRFDDAEFGHFQVAKLRLPDIDRFVHDWYRARVEDERERDVNVKDLIRILHDDEHTSIRDLAENPLLLTIIALVHRIDAVLPDERVVLYQKCTETLLNTWHTWKFRDAEVRDRGKVERRNRRRLEVIASWMHQQGSEAETSKRSIVSYANLKSFLTNHIASTEKSSDPEKDPEDLAEEFLEFVKTRAGLLIEVGDQHYSFVHLTFQEYLTSASIITSGETGGVKSYWDAINNHCGDPGWNEVIRLLIAGLRSDEAQEALTQNILESYHGEQQINVALLLAGVLLDNVSVTHQHRQEIIMDIFHAASITEDSKQLDRLLSSLRDWTKKDSRNQEIIILGYKSLWLKENISGLVREALRLIPFCLNWIPENFNIVPEWNIPEIFPDRDWYGIFLDRSIKPDFSHIETYIKSYWYLQDSQTLTSFRGTFGIIIEEAIFLAFTPHVYARRAFIEQLLMLNYNSIEGPAAYSLLYCALVILGGINIDKAIIETSLSLAEIGFIIDMIHKQSQSVSFENSKYYNTKMRAFHLDSAMETTHASSQSYFSKRNRALDQNKDRETADPRSIDLERFRIRAVDVALNRAITLIDNDERVWKEPYIIDRFKKSDAPENKKLLETIKYNLEIIFNGPSQDILSKATHYWSMILGQNNDREIASDLVAIFNLKPSAQWEEAIRIYFLPRIPELIQSIFDPLHLINTTIKFEQKLDDNIDSYIAARYLIIDGLLYVLDIDLPQNKEIYAHLIELTINNTDPALTIAHCIRDIAYGNENRIQDLIAMVKSDNPSYRSIFEECYWRKTPEEEKNQLYDKNRKEKT